MGSSVLCLDVGGTYIRVGRYDPVTAGVTFVRKTPTFRVGEPDGLSRAPRFMGALFEVVQRDLTEDDVAVAVALAGPVSANGHVWALPTIARSERIQIDAISLRDQLGLGLARLYLLNDMTAAAYGLLSATRRTFCVVTVGTGLGVRLVIDGQPILGSLGLAGEIGHVRVDFSQHPRSCDCGGLGHLGGLASGRGVANSSYGKHSETVMESSRANPEFDFIYAYRQGDVAAKAEILRQGTLLGRTLAPLLVACGISDVVLMGGAVEAMQPDYANAVRAAVSDSIWEVIRELQPPRVSVEVDDLLPLLGAGRFALLHEDSA